MKNSDKHTLRKQFRNRRNRLSQEQQCRAASALLKQVLSSGVLQRVKTLALFIANDGEISPEPLLHYCWQQNIATYVPALDPQKNGYLRFYPYDSSTQLIPNRWGIPEPNIDASTPIPVTQLDLVLLPLVAFSKLGQRLGMGGGFYDRTFECLQTTTGRQVKLVGVAHQCQQTECIATDDWDINMDAIITDTQYLEINRC